MENRKRSARKCQIAVQVGSSLLRLVSPEHGAPLLDYMGDARSHMPEGLRHTLPGIRFYDNLRLGHKSFMILINNKEVWRGDAEAEGYLVFGPREKISQLKRKSQIDPFSRGMPEAWITGEELDKAKEIGLVIHSPSTAVGSIILDV